MFLSDAFKLARLLLRHELSAYFLFLLVKVFLPIVLVLSCERFLTAPLTSVVADRLVRRHDILL